MGEREWERERTRASETKGIFDKHVKRRFTWKWKRGRWRLHTHTHNLLFDWLMKSHVHASVLFVIVIILYCHIPGVELASFQHVPLSKKVGGAIRLKSPWVIVAWNHHLCPFQMGVTVVQRLFLCLYGCLVSSRSISLTTNVTVAMPKSIAFFVSSPHTVHCWCPTLAHQRVYMPENVVNIVRGGQLPTWITVYVLKGKTFLASKQQVLFNLDVVT